MKGRLLFCFYYSSLVFLLYLWMWGILVLCTDACVCIWMVQHSKSHIIFFFFNGTFQMFCDWNQNFHYIQFLSPSPLSSVDCTAIMALKPTLHWLCSQLIDMNRISFPKCMSLGTLWPCSAQFTAALPDYVYVHKHSLILTSTPVNQIPLTSVKKKRHRSVSPVASIIYCFFSVNESSLNTSKMYDKVMKQCLRVLALQH